MWLIEYVIHLQDIAKIWGEKCVTAYKFSGKGIQK